MGVVSAIVPTWNRADLLRSILANLRQQTRPPDQIIVVDNGSTDGSHLVAREFGVDLSSFAQNRGFAAAVNEGIRRAQGDWLLILNNDVVLEPDWLARLLASAEQEGAPFAAGKLLQKDGPHVLDGSWDLVSRAAYAWRCGWGRPDGEIWSTRRKIWFAPMTAALFHRSVFERIGLLETRFESYYEDVDFGVRCALAGLEGVYEPAAVATHIGTASLGRHAGRVLFLTARNQVFLLAKHYPAKTLLRFAWPILWGQTLSVLAAAKKGHLLAALRGKWEALRQWSSFRQELKKAGASQNVEAAFSRSEREIRNLQRQIGFDIYWRLYFSLVGRA